jgi:MoxR-like ATPase
MNIERQEIERLQRQLKEGIRQMNRHIVGNSEAVHLTMAAVICQKDTMLTSYRGRGKTALGEACANIIEGANFVRHQCTPQSRPSDITGMEIFDEKTKDYRIAWSPMMNAVVGLWDEINRADEEFQSGLMEVAENGRATVSGSCLTESRKLPDPFVRIYTRNPDGQVGTNRLADPTRDRILFDVDMLFPSEDDMIALDENVAIHRGTHKNTPFLTMDDVKLLRDINDDMVLRASRDVKSYRYRLCAALQPDLKMFRTLQLTAKDDFQKQQWIDTISDNPAEWNIHNLQVLDDGVSTRATMWLLHAACALAFLEGRTECTIPDVQRAWVPCTRHKLIMRPSARTMGIFPEDILRAARETVKA